MKRMFCLALILVVGAAQAAVARDWYVRVGATGGDGSLAKPLGAIEDALTDALAGDVIHVAEGLYYGKGGGGKWVVKTPNIVLVGGYKSDFSARHPWRYPTVLMRKPDPEWNLHVCRAMGCVHDLAAPLASYNPEALLGQGTQDDATNLVVDGFVLDAHTRHAYKANGDLTLGLGPGHAAAIRFHSPGVKVRNCLVVNGYYGIGLPAQGTEISNCIVMNTIDRALDFQTGNGEAVVRNNTVGFVWNSGEVEGYGLQIGREAKLQIEKNIFMFANIAGVNNGHQNRYCRMTSNVFFQNAGGVYKYWDPQTGGTLYEDDVTKLNGRDARNRSLSAQSSGNVALDPGVGDQVDSGWFDRYLNQIQSTGGGKVEWNAANQWRSMLGLPLQGSAGSGRVNFAPAYRWEKAFLFPRNAEVSGIGAQYDGPFETYKSTSVAAAAKTYVQVPIDDLLDMRRCRQHAGKNAEVICGYYGKEPSNFPIPGVTRDEYNAYRLRGMSASMPYILAFCRKGSQADQRFKNDFKQFGQGEVDPYDTILVQGTIHDISSGTTDRIAIVVDDADLAN